MSDGEAAEENHTDDEQDDEQRTQNADMTADETTDPDAAETDDVDTDNDVSGVLAIRKTVRSTAGQLVGHEFDGVSEISQMDGGWRAVVEVVERSAVPDTQDIIGRYEIELDEDGVVQGYRRLDRYRRGDTTAFE